MTHEEKAKWIKYLNDFAYEQDGEYGQGRISPEDVCLKIASALAKAEKKGREEGIKYKCQLIAECKEQWIDECEKVARSHSATFEDLRDELLERLKDGRA